MPIRPENRDRYPDDWPAISWSVKEEAGWQCECLGECGRGTHDGRCPNRHDAPAYGTGSIVILTTAHLNHTPEDCRRENLRAFCQGCHLFYDRHHHAETRWATRRRELADAGQGDLFDLLELVVEDVLDRLGPEVEIPPSFLAPPAIGSAEAFRIATAADEWNAAIERRAAMYRPAWEQVIALAARATVEASPDVGCFCHGDTRAHPRTP